METYVVTNNDIFYIKDFVDELKRLNPMANICVYWIDKYERANDIRISCSEPLEKLNLPQGNFSNIFKDKIIISLEEYNNENNNTAKEELKFEFLNFFMSRSDIIKFAHHLQELNPDAVIRYSYDQEKYCGKIESSKSFDYLNFPLNKENNYGVDVNGYVGLLQDKRKTYVSYNIPKKIGYGYEFVEETIQYFPDVSYEEQLRFSKVAEDKITWKFDFIELNFSDTTMAQEPLEEKKKEVLVKHEDTEPKEKLIVELNLGRRFKVYARFYERMDIKDELKHAKNRAGFIAGLCILGSVASHILIDEDLNNQIQERLSSLTSWKGLEQLIKGTNPVANFLSIGAAVFIAKYGLKSRKLKNMESDTKDNTKQNIK